MMSRTIFREHGAVIRTQRLWRRWLGAALWPAVALMSLLSVAAVAAWTVELDDLKPAPDAVEVVQMSAFEAGRLAEQQAAAHKMVMAYKQGWADALAEAERRGRTSLGGLQAGAGVPQ